MDIVVYSGATWYWRGGLPYRERVARWVDGYSEARLQHTETPWLLESAAAGSLEAVEQLRREHPTLTVTVLNDGSIRVYGRAVNVRGCPDGG